MNVQVAKTGLAELIDVEAYSKDSIALDMIEEIHTAGAKVIGSNHHFNETPTREKDCGNINDNGRTWSRYM